MKILDLLAVVDPARRARSASSGSSSGGSARARSTWRRSSLLGLLRHRGHDLRRSEHAAAQHLPPGLGLDAAATARDLHHARAGGPPHRPRAGPSGSACPPVSGWPSRAWMAVGVGRGGALPQRAFARTSTRRKDILYIVGAYALAAGVPVRRYFDSGDLFKLGYLAVACISVVDLMSIGRSSTSTPICPSSRCRASDKSARRRLRSASAVVAMCFMCRMASGPDPRPPRPGAGSRGRRRRAGQSACRAGEPRRGRAGAARGARRREPAAASARRFSVGLGQRGADLLAIAGSVHRRPGRAGRSRPAAGEGSPRDDVPESVPQRGQGGIGPGPLEPGRGGGDADSPSSADRVRPRGGVPVLRSREPARS